MKAVRIFEHGGTDVLRYDDFPMPQMGPTDVLVKVLSTTVSRWDIKYRNGKSGFSLPGRKPFPLPMQLGRDTAGVVEAVGAQVKLFKAGDRVVGLVHPANPASLLTIRGLGNLSSDVDYPGHTMFGGNTQFAVRPESYCIPLPDGVDMDDAAAAMWSYATAHRILQDRLGLGLGDKLLVVGASGGMGSATMDLARSMGIELLAVTRNLAKVGFLDRLGASEVFVTADGDPTAKIRFASAPLGVDGAVDFSGDPAMLRLCVDVLRPGGTMVIVAGEGSGEPIPVKASDFIRLELNLKGARASTIKDQVAVLDLLRMNRIHPVIHRKIPMSEIKFAHEHLESGDVSGRILLDPWS